MRWEESFKPAHPSCPSTLSLHILPIALPLLALGPSTALPLGFPPQLLLWIIFKPNASAAALPWGFGSCWGLSEPLPKAPGIPHSAGTILNLCLNPDSHLGSLRELVC